MSERWTPESHVRITGDGMVIEIKLHGILLTSVAAAFEKGVLRIRGQHEDFGKFESRFEIPPNHNPIAAKITLENSVLHIDVPLGKQKKDVVLGPIPIPIKFSGILPKPAKIPDTFWSARHSMMIYCNGCGMHFDIVIEGKGARNYCCPKCGNAQAFDLEVLINQAIEQSQKMFRRKRGRR